MDAASFRWVLVVIAVVLALGVYLFGQHQSRLRKRNAIESFTREEIDSAFVEDEQLRFELNNLNQILQDNEDEENLEDIEIVPGAEAQETPYALPDPKIYLPTYLEAKDEDRLISYHLRHSDFRLITGEEASVAMREAGLERNADNLLECRQEGELAFQVASLSQPGHFAEIEQLDFSTLGLNCFIDLDVSDNPRLAYETLLKKVDELVRALNVKVYKPTQELLTISDVTATREQLA